MVTTVIQTHSAAILLNFAQVNFVGKLLGPQGSTIKRLQEETGAKISVLGKGSMRDKNKVCIEFSLLHCLKAAAPLFLWLIFCMLSFAFNIFIRRKS